LYSKKSAIVKIQVEIILIVIVVAAVAGVFAYYTYFAPKPSPARPTEIPTPTPTISPMPTLTPTPSPTPTKPETPTPVPPAVARVKIELIGVGIYYGKYHHNLSIASFSIGFGIENLGEESIRLVRIEYDVYANGQNLRHSSESFRHPTIGANQSYALLDAFNVLTNEVPPEVWQAVVNGRIDWYRFVGRAIFETVGGELKVNFDFQYEGWRVLVTPPPDETKKDFIISDKEYRDYQSMSLTQIQRFLEDHNSFLASYRTQDVEGVERSAAEIIFNAAQKYYINPRVIIVTLQKEQSLITTPPGKENECQLRKAMGYENPDYYGFANQIDAGTWQLDKYYRDIETKGTTVSEWGVGITKRTQDGVYVTPENIATACLYSYTPWAGYQWGGNRSDVGGNYLFWYFYDKFGFYELTP